MKAVVALVIVAMVVGVAVGGKHPVNGGWTNWSSYTQCTKTCGGGTQGRDRTCTNPTPKNGGRKCYGPSWESRGCNYSGCPVDGRWSSWSPYTTCSHTCGGGTQSRWRTCTNPPAQNGGDQCYGKSDQTRKCNKSKCPRRY